MKISKVLEFFYILRTIPITFQRLIHKIKNSKNFYKQ